MNEERIREKIKQAMTDGKICYRTIEGIFCSTLESFIKQPLEGMLYDINRDKATIMSFIDDPAWVNNLALTQLLEYYYNRCKQLEEEMSKFVKVEGIEEDWFMDNDKEYMSGFSFDEPVELPVDVYIRKKGEGNETQERE